MATVYVLGLQHSGINFFHYARVVVQGHRKMIWIRGTLLLELRPHYRGGPRK